MYKNLHHSLNSPQKIKVDSKMTTDLSIHTQIEKLLMIIVYTGDRSWWNDLNEKQKSFYGSSRSYSKKTISLRKSMIVWVIEDASWLFETSCTESTAYVCMILSIIIYCSKLTLGWWTSQEILKNMFKYVWTDVLGQQFPLFPMIPSVNNKSSAYDISLEPCPKLFFLISCLQGTS
jgi:hypothetical protein